MSGRLAWVDSGGRVRCRDPGGGEERVIAGPWLSEEPEEGEDLIFRWPTWSPTGDRLAVEGSEPEEEDGERAIVWALTADGVRAEALEELSEELVYLQWEEAGEGLLLLTGTSEGDLHLRRAGQDVPALLDGSPLFFCTTSQGEIVAHVFAGEPGRARLVVLPPGGAEPQVLTDRPGRFQAPCALPDGRVLFTVQEGRKQRLASWSRSRGLEEIPSSLGEARVSLLTDPSGGLLVASGEPEDIAFERLDVWDRTARPDRVCDIPFAAALPLVGGGAALLIAEDSGAFAWQIVGTPFTPPAGPLMSFVPTEEEALRLGFMDQYHRSHPQVSPDGRTIAVAGVDVGAPPVPGGPQIYLLPVDGTAPPERVGPGRFAVWGPPPDRR